MCGCSVVRTASGDTLSRLRTNMPSDHLVGDDQRPERTRAADLTERGCCPLVRAGVAFPTGEPPDVLVLSAFRAGSGITSLNLRWSQTSEATMVEFSELINHYNAHPECLGSRVRRGQCPANRAGHDDVNVERADQSRKICRMLAPV